MELFDANFKALDAALGATGLRQQVLSNNLANVNTPGFKRSDVTFEDQLAAALQDSQSPDSSSAALDGFQPKLQVDSTTSMRADGNNVDVDNEMANLAENNVRYNALVQMASKQLHMLETAINGR